MNIRPILVDENNVIGNGDTRVRAARELGMTEVPVVVVRTMPVQDRAIKRSSPEEHA